MNFAFCVSLDNNNDEENSEKKKKAWLKKFQNELKSLKAIINVIF